MREVREDAAGGLRSPLGLAAVAVGAVAVIVAGLLSFQSNRTVHAPAVSPRIVPLTSFPGREMDPAFAPQGDRVAFAWDGEKGENFDIYVKLIGSEKPLRLTSHAADERSPAWSPDGRQIAFYRRSNGGAEIIIVPALGGAERKVGGSSATWMPDYAGPHQRLDWSPDGRWLAYVDRSAPQESDSIFLLSIDTPEKRRMTLPPEGNDAFPAFSPDGRRLAFLRWDQPWGSGSAYLLSLGDPLSQGKPVDLTGKRRMHGLAWTPDGNSIVFSSGDGFWLVPAHLPGRSGAQPARQLLEERGYLFSPSVATSSGKGLFRLAYARIAWQRDILSAELPTMRDVGTLARTVLRPTRLVVSTLDDSSPQFSPNGGRIAFSSRRTGSGEIWICDGDGSNALQLTSLGLYAGSPRWSPDGRLLAFNALGAGHLDIYVVSANGGTLRRVTTETSQNARPSWSRDRRWIYFGSNRDGTWQVWKVPSEGGPAVRITNNGGREPFESPDGKFIYYAKELGTAGIWRVPVDGGDEIRVTENGIQGGWAVSERGLYYVNSRAGGRATVEFFRFATRRISEIAEFPAGVRLSTTAPHFAVSPDGRRILYVPEGTESDIMLAEDLS